MSSTREALEAALAANPDDLAIHAAYADLLIEQGDPRGEYIRLRLALEDGDQPADLLGVMGREAYCLWLEHEQVWLEPLAKKAVEVTWHRGWVQVLHLDRLTPATARVVTELTVLRLLQHLVIGDVAADVTVADNLHPMFNRLVRGPLRILQLGSGPGDDVVNALVDSGLVTRLDWLALRDCGITDDGADLLARHLRPGQLRRLDLTSNHISPIGAEALAAAGYFELGWQDLGPEEILTT